MTPTPPPDRRTVATMTATPTTLTVAEFIERRPTTAAPEDET